MIKEIWRDPVWSKVISSGVVFLIVFIGTYLLNVCPQIWNWLSSMWSIVISSTLTPNWLLGLMVILCGFLVLVKIKDWFTAKEQEINSQNYTTDSFLNLIWSWQYVGGQIDHLHALCPECECQIKPKINFDYYDDGYYNYNCNFCSYSPGFINDNPEVTNHKIRLKIQKVLQTGEWKNK